MTTWLAVTKNRSFITESMSPRASKKQTGRVAIEERGSLLEGWVATLLRAYGEIHGMFDAMYYWAPAESRQTEVDFVLNRGSDFIAIEVKSGTKVSNQALSGLKAVKDLPRMVRRILLYGGRRELKSEDGVEIWPVDHFLDALASDRLWP